MFEDEEEALEEASSAALLDCVALFGESGPVPLVNLLVREVKSRGYLGNLLLVPGRIKFELAFKEDSLLEADALPSSAFFRPIRANCRCEPRRSALLLSLGGSATRL